MLTFRFILGALAAYATLWWSEPANSADIPVDLELVLAVDVSLSMDSYEQKMQLQGYVDAFRDRQVLRAIEAGPPFIDAPGDYGELLETTGWRVTERADVTPEYRQSLAALVEALQDDTALREALGDDKISESRERRQAQVDSIDAGLLKREIFLAVAS